MSSDMRVKMILEAVDNASGTFSKMKSALVATGIIATLGAMVKESAAYGDEINRLSKITGISTESLSKMSYAAKQLDVDQGALTNGIGILSKNMLAAAQGNESMRSNFERMGIQVTDSQGRIRDASDVLKDMSDYMQKKGVSNTTKMATSMEILGRSGKELIPFLKAGKDEIERLGNEAEHLGIVLDKDTAEAMDKLDDEFDKLKSAALGLSVKMTKELLPTILLLKDGFLKLWEIGNKTIEMLGKAAAGSAKERSEAEKQLKTKADYIVLMKEELQGYQREITQTDITKQRYEELRQLIEGKQIAIEKMTEAAKGEYVQVKMNNKAIEDNTEVIEDNKKVNEEGRKAVEKAVVAGFKRAEQIQEEKTKQFELNYAVADAADGLKIMEEQEKEATQAIEQMAVTWLNAANSFVNGSMTLENAFSTTVSAIASQFDPVTGAAIQLGGSIISKLLWGKKTPAEVIDENLKIISDYIDSIKFKWGKFAVDIARSISDALQMPDIEEGLSSIFKRVKSSFQKSFADMISGQIMGSAEYQERTRNIGNIMSLLSTGITYTPWGIDKEGLPTAPTGTQLVNPYTGQAEFVQTMERLKSIFLAGEIVGLKNYLTQSYSGLSGAYSELAALTNIFEIPQMAEGGIVKAMPGGTLVNVGEGGKDEIIAPIDRLPSANINVTFSGVFLASKSEMDTAFRKYLLPSLNTYLGKTGEIFG